MYGRVNIPQFKLDAVYEYVSDKFQTANLTPLPISNGTYCVVDECPIQVLATLSSFRESEGLAILDFKVNDVLVNNRLLDSNDRIVTSKWKPLIYRFREYSTTGNAIGYNFRYMENSEK